MIKESREKNDVIRTGEKALRSLKDARKSLEQTTERGMLDVLGPLSLSTGRKRALVDEAKRSLKRAKDDLKAFEEKLCALSGGADGISGFAEKYFGNVLSLDKSRVDRFYIHVKDAIKVVESELRNLKK